MQAPILASKLYIPPPRPKSVLRPQLIKRLNVGLHHKLTLISAPAGFGKTTLVNEWVASAEQPTAWLSLDKGDNTLSGFLSYLIAALQNVAQKVGEGALALLHASQPVQSQLILTSLLNDIANVSESFILVLDDYHLIDSREIDEVLSFLLRHLPPQMHVVVTTREDPSLPLSRLRARDQLTELRADDLRFSPDEAAEFFNQTMNLKLSAEDISQLETRTEGWITGLQMAALSIQGRADTASFIQAFTGSHHFVIDYLIEEVLQQQSESVKTFLLQTSILNSLCGSLCVAVTEQEDGQAMLETLARGNLFVVPLDDKREWYRYHHLFADVLQAHLIKTEAKQISSLHQRASLWYEQNDLPSEAIHHTFAAKDFERAAGLIELAWPIVDRSLQEAMWLGSVNHRINPGGAKQLQ